MFVGQTHSSQSMWVTKTLKKCVGQTHIQIHIMGYNHTHTVYVVKQCLGQIIGCKVYVDCGSCSQFKQIFGLYSQLIQCV